MLTYPAAMLGPTADDIPEGCCRICGSAALEEAFQVAFPKAAAGGRHSWRPDTVPPVPAWRFVRCRSCGVHFPDPFPSKEQVHAHYATQLEHNDWEEVHYVADTAEKRRHWAGFADKLTRLTGRPGRLLEIGPAGGHLLEACQARGWDVLGVEAAPKFVRILSDRGLPHHAGELETLPQQAPFDVIVGIDVLEHLYDPIADLRRCAQILRPGGIAVFATCDIGSLAARFYRLGWRQLVVSHTFYWTRNSLRVALARADLRTDHFSSFRWWDPDPRREKRGWMREFAKLLIRQAVFHSWTVPSHHSAWMRSIQRRHHRFDRFIDFSIGDQPVMSEVVLVVARLI